MQDLLSVQHQILVKVLELLRGGFSHEKYLLTTVLVALFLVSQIVEEHLDYENAGHHDKPQTISPPDPIRRVLVFNTNVGGEVGAT